MIFESAKNTITKKQVIFSMISLSLFSVVSYTLPILYLIIFITLAIFIYLGILSFKLFINFSFTKNDGFVRIKRRKLSKFPPRKLPVVTVLIPLYKEAKIIKNLLRSLMNLNYPKNKLDIKFLLEDDDRETLFVLSSYNLPQNWEIVICQSDPKTKPAALNIGLQKAKGKFLVIYDAEDRPNKNQIINAVVAFSNLPQNIACLQARINFWNKDTNILTKFFSAEYANHYGIFLPALCKLDLLVPLGGTSNFFRIKILKQLSGWDSYNVTEDADLAVRIAKRGYKIKMLKSTTWEEANSHLVNWVRQRSRWIKGYLQTYLVHMRHPLKLARDLGFLGFVTFQLIFGAGPIAVLISPFFWIMTVVYLVTRSSFIEMLFPPPLFYLGLICTLGNLFFIFLTMTACMKNRLYSKIPLMIFLPFYWVLLSIGAVYGLVQLIFQPHYWEKTQHGLIVERHSFR